MRAGRSPMAIPQFSETEVDRIAREIGCKMRQPLESLTAYRARIAGDMIAQGKCAKTAVEMVSGRDAMDPSNLRTFSAFLGIAARARFMVSAVTDDFYEAMPMEEARRIARQQGFVCEISEQHELQAPGDDMPTSRPHFDLWVRHQEGLILVMIGYVDQHGVEIVDEGHLFCEVAADAGIPISDLFSMADRAPHFDNSGRPLHRLFFKHSHEPGVGRVCRVPFTSALRFIADVRVSDALHFATVWSATPSVNLAGMLVDNSMPRPEDRLSADEWADAWDGLHPILRSLHVVGTAHGISPHAFQAGRRLSGISNRTRLILRNLEDFGGCLSAYHTGLAIGLREPGVNHPRPIRPAANFASQHHG
jgi:hypothetical protein